VPALNPAPPASPAPRNLSRRAALKALALPAVAGLAGLGVAGCGASGPSLNVAVTWTGWELERFRQVMEAFSGTYRIGYNLLSMGDDTGAFLSDQVTAAAQPDVALVSQPSVVHANRRRLVTAAWPSADASSWRGLLAVPPGPGAVPRASAGPGSAQYGTWFKASYQSMVWHRDDLPVPGGGWNWAQWEAECALLAARGRPALSVGAGTGWVLALWFANALMSVNPDLYRTLAREYASGARAGPGPAWRHPDVAVALRRLASLWRIPRLFPGGAERALAIQFDQSVLDVFGNGAAEMVAGPDFFWPIITQTTQFDQGRVRWFRFPAGPGEQPPAVVAGDAAVAFRRPGGNVGGRTLVSWLGSAQAARSWAQAGGFLSINDGVGRDDYESYPATMNVPDMIAAVRLPSAQFDISDQLGGSLSGDDSAGSWRIFTDFFEAVAVRRSSVPGAVAAAVDALDQGKGGA
jgi:ABC-type glycerol-3-phosphate transport system substrate-binding protein